MYLSNILQVKAGDVRVLANTSFLLVKKDWSSEIRLHAFKMLQVCVHISSLNFILLILFALLTAWLYLLSKDVLLEGLWKRIRL